MYLIKRNDGKYVSWPGSEHSYTRRIDLARVYPTRKEAEQDLCIENEQIISIPQVFKQEI